MKWQLQRIRLNNGGYDSFGSYWGHDLPLYWACDVDMQQDSRYIRARDREHAKSIVRGNYDIDATFYR